MVVNTIDLPPDLAIIFFFALLALFAVISALVIIDRNEGKIIKLTKRIESLERTNSELAKDVYEWQGLPRRLLESDLSDKEVI